MYRTFVLILTLFCINTLLASALVILENGTIVGEVERGYSEVDETIDEVGRRFNLGYYEMARANPHVNPVYALPANTPLVIPSQFILPDTPKTGIVINLAEYRLYYYPHNENIVVTFPIGIGRKGWDTPLGLTKIVSKSTNPTWTPSTKLRRAAEEQGAPIPEVFPAGQDNPLGKHVLRLGWPSYLIHGTNRMDGVGTRVSAGCIRMLPEDVEELFNLVPTGTPVRVINDPVKITNYEGHTYIQIYPLLSDNKINNLRLAVNNKLKNYNAHPVNRKIIEQELAAPSGIARLIN